MAAKEDAERAQETPWVSNDLELLPPTKDCLRRIRSDYKSFVAEKLQGIYCLPSEDIITKYHALIIGPFDTPYEGGFFLFTIIFPPTYPCEAPFVKFEGTGAGQVRFNPNLYRNGKVCLSILGTKGGDNDWNPTQNLTSILLSIQSILNDDPYHNVPVDEPSNAKGYAEYVRHEVLRVAVCQMISNPLPTDILPVRLRETIISLFPSFYDSYELTCLENSHMDGQSLRYCRLWSKFRYQTILTQLHEIREQLGLSDDNDDEEEEEEDVAVECGLKMGGEQKLSANR